MTKVLLGSQGEQLSSIMTQLITQIDKTSDHIDDLYDLILRERDL